MRALILLSSLFAMSAGAEIPTSQAQKDQLSPAVQAARHLLRKRKLSESYPPLAYQASRKMVQSKKKMEPKQKEHAKR